MNTKCPYHHFPSVHPAQTGPDPVYGCNHPDIVSFQEEADELDFVPIVNCKGILRRCEKDRILAGWSEMKRLRNELDWDDGGATYG